MKTKSGDVLVRDIRCRPFADRVMRTVSVVVESPNAVLVWDSVAAHYTRCHSLSRATQRRIAARIIDTYAAQGNLAE